MKEENAVLLETIRKLKEENRSLLMIPRTMAHWDEFKGYDDDVVGRGPSGFIGS